MLVVSYCQSLDTAGAWPPGNKICVFYGTPGPADRKPVEKLNAWQEVSITSSQISDIVRANEKLELGDQAGWTPADMSGAAVDMCSHAFPMLRQMDGVGWEDENGVQIAVQTKDSNRQTSAPQYTRPPVIW